jgi:hypothetical protein
MPDTPQTALDGTLFASDPLAFSPADTEQALPLSADARGRGTPDDDPDPGGDGIPAAPEPPERPDYPRIDTSQREAPEVDQDARNRQALTGLLATLGTAFASAGDDPTMLNISAGLTQGANEQLRQRQEEFKRRQQAFNEFLTEAQRFNREMQQRETEADYERRLAAFEQQSEARQSALDRRADRRQSRTEDERQHQQTLEEIRERGEQRRRTQRVENEASGNDGESSDPIRMDDLSVPSDPVEANRRLGIVEERLRTMKEMRPKFQYQETVTQKGEDGVPRDTVVTKTDQGYKERLSSLQQYRAALQSQLPDEERQDARPRMEEMPSVFNPPLLDNPLQGGEGQSDGVRQQTQSDTDGSSQDSTGTETDPIRQAAREQAPQLDTVTQADIGAAVEQFGEGADEVRLLREIRQIQQNQ